MFKDYTLQTTKGRGFKALAIGAVVGAIIVAGFMVFALFRDFGTHIFLQNVIYSFITSFISAFIVWGVGILLVGMPIWFVLHKIGLRTWPSALLLGFLLPFTVSLLFYTSQMFEMAKMSEKFANSGYSSPNQFVVGWGRAVAVSGVLGAVGASVALTIWRIAYRRPPPC